jgi:adenylosuccinate synthase
MINGVTQLIMMKVDVLNIFDEINVCTHYRLADGTLTDQFPYDLCDNDVTPVYKKFKGWKTGLEGMRHYEDLPAELAAYINFLEAELSLPISFISTGPDREAVILRQAEVGV